MFGYAGMSRAVNKINGFVGASSLRAMGSSMRRLGKMDYATAYGNRGMQASRNFDREFSRLKGTSSRYFAGGRGMARGAALGGGALGAGGATADFLNPWGLGWGD
jgi:hypothetical protein